MKFKDALRLSTLPLAIIFVLAAALSLWVGNPGVAILLGLVLSIFHLVPSGMKLKGASKLLISVAIVVLGATVKLPEVVEISGEQLIVTVLSMVLVVGGALFLAPWLRISRTLATLIGTGTAICGASAIAAVSATIAAPSAEVAVALGVVLLFNTAALFLFPYLGELLSLSPHQFGIWAGLAIHDTSSVVGAAMSYSAASVDVATTVKLARAIWIAPLCLVVGQLFQTAQSRNIFRITPWFIWGYLAMCVLAAPLSPESRSVAGLVGKLLFSLGMFLLGAATDWKSVKAAGIRPVFLGLVLWVVSGAIGLAWIRS